jgi:hypothetical protein
MHDIKWSHSEKRHARAVFDRALTQELEERLAAFKARAAGTQSAEEMWSMRAHLEDSEHEVQRKYDFRYSQLIVVFGQLLREGRVTEEQLAGLSEEKLTYIRKVAAL